MSKYHCDMHGLYGKGVPRCPECQAQIDKLAQRIAKTEAEIDRLREDVTILNSQYDSKNLEAIRLRANLSDAQTTIVSLIKELRAVGAADTPLVDEAMELVQEGCDE